MRRWRAQVWSRRRNKREILLAAFIQYPHGTTPVTDKEKLESGVDQAKYKQRVYEDLLGSDLPRAQVRKKA